MFQVSSRDDCCGRSPRCSSSPSSCSSRYASGPIRCRAICGSTRVPARPRSSSTRTPTASPATSSQQYFNWLGTSSRSTGATRSRAAVRCGPSCKVALVNTFVLGGIATIVGVTIGLAIGIVSAMRPRSTFDHRNDHDRLRRDLDSSVRHGGSAAALLRHHSSRDGSVWRNRCCPRRACTRPATGVRPRLAVQTSDPARSPWWRSRSSPCTRATCEPRCSR